MNRFVFLGFAFLAFTFYVMSDGSSFDPEASKQALIDARKDREAARLAELPLRSDIEFAAETATPQQSSQIAVDGTADAAPAPLNIASFDEVTAPTPEPEPEPALLPLAERAEPRPIPQILVPETELSLDALEAAAAARQDIAFAGSTTSAAAGRVDNAIDIRTVQGSLVNMRAGPGTDFEVIDQLSQSTRVEILTDGGDGWVELRPVNGGPTGWIAEFLLSDG